MSNVHVIEKRLSLEHEFNNQIIVSLENGSR